YGPLNQIVRLGGFHKRGKDVTRLRAMPKDTPGHGRRTGRLREAPRRRPIRTDRHLPLFASFPSRTCTPTTSPPPLPPTRPCTVSPAPAAAPPPVRGRARPPPPPHGRRRARLVSMEAFMLSMVVLPVAAGSASRGAQQAASTCRRSKANARGE